MNQIEIHKDISIPLYSVERLQALVNQISDCTTLEETIDKLRQIAVITHREEVKITGITIVKFRKDEHQNS